MLYINIHFLSSFILFFVASSFVGSFMWKNSKTTERNDCVFFKVTFSLSTSLGFRYSPNRFFLYFLNFYVFFLFSFFCSQYSSFGCPFLRLFLFRCLVFSLVILGNFNWKWNGWKKTDWETKKKKKKGERKQQNCMFFHFNLRQYGETFKWCELCKITGFSIFECLRSIKATWKRRRRKKRRQYKLRINKKKEERNKNESRKAKWKKQE